MCVLHHSQLYTHIRCSLLLLLSPSLHVSPSLSAAVSLSLSHSLCTRMAKRIHTAYNCIKMYDKYSRRPTESTRWVVIAIRLSCKVSYTVSFDHCTWFCVIWEAKKKTKKNHGFIPISAISFAIFWSKQHDTTGIFRWIIIFFWFTYTNFSPFVECFNYANDWFWLCDDVIVCHRLVKLCVWKKMFKCQRNLLQQYEKKTTSNTLKANLAFLSLLRAVSSSLVTINLHRFVA